MSFNLLGAQPLSNHVYLSSDMAKTLAIVAQLRKSGSRCKDLDELSSWGRGGERAEGTEAKLY